MSAASSAPARSPSGSTTRPSPLSTSAGNALANPVSRSFRVIQQATVDLAAMPNLTGYIGRNCDYKGSTRLRCEDTANKASSIQFGDLDYEFVPGQTGVVRFRSLRGFLSFDINPIPASTTRIVSASLTISLYKTHGNPFAKLGGLRLERVNYGPTLNGREGDYDVPALECTTGPCSGLYTGAPAGPSDVTPLVTQAWLERLGLENRAQFRFLFEKDTNGDNNDDSLEYHWENTGEPSVRPKLKVTYQFP